MAVVLGVCLRDARARVCVSATTRERRRRKRRRRRRGRRRSSRTKPRGDASLFSLTQPLKSTSNKNAISYPMASVHASASLTNRIGGGGGVTTGGAVAPAPAMMAPRPPALISMRSGSTKRRAGIDAFAPASSSTAGAHHGHRQRRNNKPVVAAAAAASGSGAGGGDANNDPAKTSPRDKLAAYGVAGVVAYGILNTLYYTFAFAFAWFYLPTQRRAGHRPRVGGGRQSGGCRDGRDLGGIAGDQGREGRGSCGFGSCC